MQPSWTFDPIEFILATRRVKHFLKVLIVWAVAGAAARASTLDTTGVTVLRATTTNLNGAGVRVGQAEAQSGANDWQVNPGNSQVTQPVGLFTYHLSNPPYLTVVTTNAFPNALGVESGHADGVAGGFYGIAGGVATNVSHVDNYEANTMVAYYVGYTATPHTIQERIVNQSFTFGSVDTNADQAYDNYAAQNGVLFVSGAGFRGQPVFTPATGYNGIGVGIAGVTDSPTGPTPDGRSKPDIIAPNPLDPQTSWAAPQVAGAAAVLMQAGTRGDGGSDTNSATDIRTVKALLLNGAVKPSDWTNSFSHPLHARYGAGVLNVFNSYKQLAGRRQTNIVSATVSAGSAHPPTGATNTIPVLSAWDLGSLTSQAHPAMDAVNHYYFNVTNATSNAPFTATITLAWNRQSGKTAINDLNLFLYDTANSNLITCSTSVVDNVEHLFIPRLPQGRYDLQVWKSGATAFVTGSETYALAWEFFSETATTTLSGNNLVVSWPVYPDGYVVESTTGLSPPQSWSTAGIPAPAITNNHEVVTIAISPSVTNRFFRLRRP
jgi:Subtilase family